MNEFIQTVSGTASLSTIGMIVLKASVLILIAALITTALRSAPAAARHGVWVLALSGVLMLSPLTLMLPEWRVPVLSTLATSAPEVTAAAVPLVPEASVAESATHGSAGAQALSSASHHAEAAAGDPVRSFPLPWAATIWFIGTMAVLLYVGMGALRAWLWTRRSEPVRDMEWTELARDLRWMVGIDRNVEPRWHREAVTPMTWGVTRPVILLPAEAETWSAERRRVVLLHELAHVRRFDCLTQFLIQVTCALHWFNPLVWWAASKARSERERACDEAVLRNGTRPSNYASHLLDIARSARSRFAVPAGAVAMARQSELEGRLVAILDFTHGRRPLSRGKAVLGVCATLFFLLPLAAFSPVVLPHGVIAADDSLVLSQSAVAEFPSDEASDLDSSQSATGSTGDAPQLVASEEDVVRRQFSVRPGGTLVIDSDLGSIQVSAANGREVAIEVERSIRGRSNASPEDLQLSFEQSGNDVRVVARRSSRNVRGLNARFVVIVPQRYNVDLKTGGGSISVDDLDGNVVTSTSGGSLRFGRIAGDIDGRTSGGSIRLEGSSGNASLHTSGGSITLGRVEGDVEARTSGGSISVTDVQGNLTAETSGGSIRARMSQPPRRASRLETSGGSITLALHRDAAVSLDARTSSGRVTTDFPVPDRPRDQQSHLRAALNGGGPDLILRTSAGSIRINRIDPGSDARHAPRSESSKMSALADIDGHDFSAAEFEARMEAMGERIGIWAEKLAERSIAPVIEWVESPEFAAWIDQMAVSATEVSVRAIDEALMALESREVRELLYEDFESVPESVRHRFLKRLAREHPDAEVRERARCMLDETC